MLISNSQNYDGVFHKYKNLLQFVTIIAYEKSQDRGPGVCKYWIILDSKNSSRFPRSGYFMYNTFKIQYSFLI